jgi:hypothetical protein
MNTVKGAFWLVGGAGIGAGFTYLYATRKGRRMRRQLSRMLDSYRYNIEDSGRDLLERGKELAESARTFWGERSRVFQH